MNTHILISIKDIEGKIHEALNKYLQREDTEKNWIKSCIYESLLQNKQISLDEKDIEEKADQFGRSWQVVKNSDEFLSNPEKYKGRYDGYKQALKDLV